MEDKRFDIDTSHRRHVLVRRAVVVLVFVLAIAGIGFGTVMLLRGIAPRGGASSANKNTAPLDYKEVIALYGKPGTIPGLADSVYSQQNDTLAAVLLKDESRSYSVSVSTDQTILYRAKSKLSTDDSQAIQDQMASFMNSSGYKEVESQQKSASGGPFYKTYQSDSAVCQLTDSGLNVPEEALPYHMLACLEKATISKEYDIIEKMLALYKQTNNVPVFTSVSRSSVVEGDKSLMTLRLSSDDKNTTLLFAAINDNWEYICNLSGGNGSASTKYSVSSEIKKTLKNPKYGDFLTRYVLGGA